ncbi:hypothetical protein T439DRAFT_324621 [Meredithblackwellia eburnea MCA 4105]
MMLHAQDEAQPAHAAPSPSPTAGDTVPPASALPAAATPVPVPLQLVPTPLQVPVPVPLPLQSSPKQHSKRPSLSSLMGQRQSSAIGALSDQLENQLTEAAASRRASLDLANANTPATTRLSFDGGKHEVVLPPKRRRGSSLSSFPFESTSTATLSKPAAASHDPLILPSRPFPTHPRPQSSLREREPQRRRSTPSSLRPSVPVWIDTEHPVFPTRRSSLDAFRTYVPQASKENEPFVPLLVVANEGEREQSLVESTLKKLIPELDSLGIGPVPHSLTSATLPTPAITFPPSSSSSSLALVLQASSLPRPPLSPIPSSPLPHLSENIEEPRLSPSPLRTTFGEETSPDSNMEESKVVEEEEEITSSVPSLELIPPTAALSPSYPGSTWPHSHPSSSSRPSLPSFSSTPNPHPHSNARTNTNTSSIYPYSQTSSSSDEMTRTRSTPEVDLYLLYLSQQEKEDEEERKNARLAKDAKVKVAVNSRPVLPPRAKTSENVKTRVSKELPPLPLPPPLSLSGVQVGLVATVGVEEEKRYLALLELCDTELAYLEGLRVLVQIYFHTLPFLTFLSQEQIVTIVRNAEALLRLHERIGIKLARVEREIGWRRTAGTGADASGDAKVRRAAARIARVFLDEIHNFSLYNDFCARQGEAVDLVRSLDSRSEWEAYERQCAQAVLAKLSRRSGALSLPAIVTHTTTASSSEDNTPTSSPVATVPGPAALSSSSFGSSPLVTSPTIEGRPFFLPQAQQRQQQKLRFQDYAISPVQRICRYPLVFASVLKNLTGGEEGEDKVEVQRAWEAMKNVVDEVDEARRLREGELRTKIVASRMEFQTPTGWAFCDVLGPTLLIGALHVLHRWPSPDGLRNKYYGCFLYRTHLVMVKIRKRDSYEPREWLPLRRFELINVPEGEGFLPYNIRLSYRDHHFELGATCASEKAVWWSRLVAAQLMAHRQWDEQQLDQDGLPTLFDDTLVSSVYPGDPTPTALRAPSPLEPPSPNHSRSKSAPASEFSTQGRRRSSSMTSDRPSIGLSASPSSPVEATSPTLGSFPGLTSRNRLSATASSLLGRTPSAQRHAIDLKLADVFSDECLAARALAAKEASLGIARRRATSSGPKVSTIGNGSSSNASTFSKLSIKERRRISSVDFVDSNTHSDFRGAVGFDFGLAQVYRDDGSERKWSASLKRSKTLAINTSAANNSTSASLSGKSRRPTLPQIDTALAESGKKLSGAGTWKARATKSLRRAASHSSVRDDDGRGRSPNVVVVFPPTLPIGSADVERNNSVSSTTSSSGTHSTSTSQAPLDTPLSSLPPSPELIRVELEAQPQTKAPSNSSGTTTPGMATENESLEDVSKLSENLPGRQQLGLSHPDSSSTTLDVDSVTSSSWDLTAGGVNQHGFSRRASYTLSSFFGRRGQSTPALGNFLGVSPSSNSPMVSLSGSPSSQTSIPHALFGGVSSEPVTPDFSPPSSVPPSPRYANLALTAAPPLIIPTTAPKLQATSSSSGNTTPSSRKIKALLKFQASHALSPVN